MFFHFSQTNELQQRCREFLNKIAKRLRRLQNKWQTFSTSSNDGNNVIIVNYYSDYTCLLLLKLDNGSRSFTINTKSIVGEIGFREMS